MPPKNKKKSFASYPGFTDPRDDQDEIMAEFDAFHALDDAAQDRFQELYGVSFDEMDDAHSDLFHDILDELADDPRFSTAAFMPTGHNRASYGDNEVVYMVNRDHQRAIDTMARNYRDPVDPNFPDDGHAEPLVNKLRTKNRNNRVNSAKATIQKAASNYLAKGRGDAGVKLMERSRYFNTLPPEVARKIGAMAGTRVVTAARRLPKYIAEGGVDTKPQRKRLLSDAVPEIHAPAQRKRGKAINN
jgi:hypothetical protein